MKIAIAGGQLGGKIETNGIQKTADSKKRTAGTRNTVRYVATGVVETSYLFSQMFIEASCI